MKDGYYLARFHKDDFPILLEFYNGNVFLVIRSVDPFKYNFGSIADFMRRFPEIELKELYP